MDIQPAILNETSESEPEQMVDVKQAVLSELEDLPEARQADVLAFIRFLKVQTMDLQEIERRFDRALARARAAAAERGLTDQDIADEIEAFRSGE